MGLIATVLEWLRASADGESYREATCDPGDGANLTPQVAFPPGFDAEGLPGDLAVLVEIGGGKTTVAFVDPKISPLAGAGEVVLFSRSAPGAVAGKIHLKADGTIDLNGVTISTSGEITAPGEITAMGLIPLSTHKHPTGVGPSGPPTP